jgi:type IV pilus assembly protein PilB
VSWRIGEILVREKWITWDQLEEALKEQEKTHELIGRILIRKGFVYPSVVYKVLAKQSQMVFLDLARARINPKAVAAVPRSIADKFQIMPVELREGVLTLAVPSPTHMWPRDELLEMACLKDVKTVLAMEDDIRAAIRDYYGGQGHAAARAVL